MIINIPKGITERIEVENLNFISGSNISESFSLAELEEIYKDFCKDFNIEYSYNDISDGYRQDEVNITLYTEGPYDSEIEFNTEQIGKIALDYSNLSIFKNCLDFIRIEDDPDNVTDGINGFNFIYEVKEV